MEKKKELGERTKHIKKTLNPEWNEKIDFPFSSLDATMHSEIQIIVVHYDKSCGDEYMGEVRIVFKDIQWDTVKSYKLHSMTSEEISGEIELAFLDPSPQISSRNPT